MLDRSFNGNSSLEMTALLADGALCGRLVNLQNNTYLEQSQPIYVKLPKFLNSTLSIFKQFMEDAKKPQVQSSSKSVLNLFTIMSRGRRLLSPTQNQQSSAANLTLIAGDVNVLLPASYYSNVSVASNFQIPANLVFSDESQPLMIPVKTLFP